VLTAREPTLSFEEFCAHLDETMGVPSADLDRDASLAGDLGFDSLDMAELVVLVEDLGGVAVPEDAFGTLATIGEVYDYYRGAR